VVAASVPVFETEKAAGTEKVVLETEKDSAPAQ
jgi:hypothetical protein